MKRLIAITIVLTMLLSMSGCGCQHTPGDFSVTSVDTATLTMKLEQSCSTCGKVLETKECATGTAPEAGKMYLSPADWFSCLATNIRNYGASQSLMPVEPEAQEDTLLFSVVNLSGLKTVMSFHDKDGKALTTEQRSDSSAVQSIHIQAQFPNDAAPQFYILLAMIAITNNNELAAEEASQIADMIMGGMEVTDNGYVYQMVITSVEDQTVMLVINVQE